MSAPKPGYRGRYPCASCRTGYLDCATLANLGLKCCADCDNHPARWAAGSEAYTVDETRDMWARSGREIPADVEAAVAARSSRGGDA